MSASSTKASQPSLSTHPVQPKVRERDTVHTADVLTISDPFHGDRPVGSDPDAGWGPLDGRYTNPGQETAPAHQDCV